MHPNISAVFGTHDANTLVQLEDVASRAAKVALMADGHLGYVMPIGGVAAYHNQVSVVGVGFDIACGNAAIRTDLNIHDLTAFTVEELRGESALTLQSWRLNQLADEIQATVSFGVGRKNRSDDAPVNHPLFDSPAWDHVPTHAREALKAKAREQLGTVGSGNHYVDVFYDESGDIWVGVHFGSRGLGHTIASGVLALDQGLQWGARPKEQEALLDITDGLGARYWALMNLAGEYAYAGREWVARKVVELLGGKELELVHNHHNFAWQETHSIHGEDQDVIVVRKGATPAMPWQKGFVGGSMGDNSVILQGTSAVDVLVKAELPIEGIRQVMRQQEAALFSTVHGAGRVMSRTAAAGKRNRRTGELKDPSKPGLVTPDMMKSWLAQKGVVLRGGGLDESPHAYRRLPDVLEAQQGTVQVLHTLTPLVVVMAGANEFDPYKD